MAYWTKSKETSMAEGNEPGESGGIAYGEGTDKSRAWWAYVRTCGFYPENMGSHWKTIRRYGLTHFQKLLHTLIVCVSCSFFSPSLKM